MSNEAANSPSWLTSEYLTNMLQTFLKEDSINVRNFTIEAGSAPGDSYAAQLLRIKISYTQKSETKTRSIIAKAIPQTDLSKEWGQGGFDMYQTEIKMMSTLPLLHQELSEKGITEPLYPYLYKLDTVNNMIFMQDLKEDGYSLVDRKLFLDLDHVLLAVKTLALFHASSYLLFQKNPNHKEKYLGYLHTKQKGSILERFSEGSFRYLLMSLDKWPISQDDKDIFRSFEGRLYDLSTDSYARRDDSFNLLIHGDYTIRNMMFTYKDGKVDSIKIFDYQGCNYNSIGLDFNLFLFTSAQNYVIMEHLDEVFRCYYEEFVKVTGKIEGFSVDTVRKEFLERLSNGFELSLLLRCVMHSEVPCHLNAFLEGRDSEINIKMYQNPNYISDVAKLLPLFKKHGVFKKL